MLTLFIFETAKIINLLAKTQFLSQMAIEASYLYSFLKFSDNLLIENE